MEQGLNLIQQLQQSPKWKEFEEWYNKWINTEEIQNYVIGQFVDFAEISDQNKTKLGYSDTYNVNFCFLPLEFQKGVFEKFISKDATDITVDGYLGKETYSIGATFAQWKWFNSFEELLIWYFNN